MNNQEGISIFVPNDKNIFDALHNKKIKLSDMVIFLQKRGIIVSPDLKKKELITYVASLPYDYESYIFITSLLENVNRRVKTTTTEIRAVVSNSEILKACQDIKVEPGESTQVEKKGNVTYLKVSYSEFDFSKTELNQKTTKEVIVEIKKDGDVVNIQRPANDYSAMVLERLKESLEIIKKNDVVEGTISLEEILLPKHRTAFFDNLIKLIPNHKMDDVSGIEIHHKNNIFREADEVLENAASYVKKAAVAGQSLLTSPAFVRLIEDGFYISKITWVVKHEKVECDLVELEAQFNDPEKCSHFSFIVRGIYPYNQRIGEYNTTRKPASFDINAKFKKFLYDAAKEAKKRVIELIESESNEESKVGKDKVSAG